MFISFIQSTVIWILLTVFTPLDEMTKIIISIVIFNVIIRMRIMTDKRDEKLFFEALEERIEESKEAVQENHVITALSEVEVCSFFDKLWPAWIELDEKETYIFEGRSTLKCDAPFKSDDVTLLLPPGVEYKLLEKHNAKHLADMLGVPEDELPIIY